MALFCSHYLKMKGDHFFLPANAGSGGGSEGKTARDPEWTSSSFGTRASPGWHVFLAASLYHYCFSSQLFKVSSSVQRSIEWGYKSRYASEFIEGALLGKGGFGSVHMATNRLVLIAGFQSCHHSIDSYKLS